MEAAARARRIWIFQSHPDRYDVAERLVVGRAENWVVSRYANEIRPGDIAYLWRAQSEDALYGWAKITSEVFERVPEPSQSKAVEAPASEEEPGLRVELSYRVRFDPPLTRPEIRSRPELEKLAPLHTAKGTTYPVRPHEAAALNELIRRHEFEAPPGPDVGPEAATPKPAADLVRWERLSPAAQETLGWAVASERSAGRVGTRGMLIGLVRLRDHESEPAQLLQYFGCTHEQLFDALRDVRPQPELDPAVAEPDDLTDLPQLTPNGRRALELAFELQADPAAPVDVRHLFGGILEVDTSRAYEALERVLEDRVPIERISETYPAYLPSGMSYRAFLDMTLAEREGIEWIPDSPAERDLLNRRKLAEFVATSLRRLRKGEREAGVETETEGGAGGEVQGARDASFLIHVDGPWGSGKSTLLDFLEENLEAGQDKWLVVRYDAWRETRVGPPWWTLLVQLRQALARSWGRGGRVRLWAIEAWPRVRAAWLLYVLVLVLAIALFVVIGRDQTIAYVTAFTTFFAGAAAVSRFFLWDSAQGARVYESVQKNPMESLSDHFARLIEKSPLPVVFLVDELDRCTDAQVVDVLDSIQTMIRDAPRKRALRSRKPGSRRRPRTSKPPYFVVAADGAWIRRSYELAHERMATAVAEPGRPLGYLFLAKIFQLTVPMPSLSPERRSDYLHRLLSGGQARPAPTEPVEPGADLEGLRERMEASTREDQVLEVLEEAAPEAREALAPLALDRLNTEEVRRETQEHVLDKFAPLLEPNPRAIKRSIFAYGIDRAVRTLEGSVVPRDTLFLWTILSTRWPGLGEYLTERPGAIACVRKGQAPIGAPPELEPLFRSQAVKDVVSFSPGGPLTKRLVAECSGVRLELPRRPRSSAPHETVS